MSGDYIRLFAIYEGDRFVDVGTFDELSRRTGFTRSRLYQFRWATNSCNPKFRYQVYDIGRELLPMYERLMKRLSKMRHDESSYASSAKSQSCAEKHIIREETISEIIRIVDILQREEEQYNQAEQEGRYYQ